MEKKDKKKLILIIVLIFLILVGIGAIVYLLFSGNSEPTAISLTNASTYPAFSENTTDYVIYTSESSLTFNCSGKNVQNCDAPVPVSKGKSSYTITINNKDYIFSITKVDPNSSTLKIKSVRGNPTVWTNDAALTATVENSGEVKILEYTFDGGENWSSSNVARLLKNGVYKVQARDYFGFLSDVVTVNVTKVDTTAPTLELTREITGDSEAVLTAVAVDTGSGLAGYSWNNGATTPSIVVSTPGTYTVSVKDIAGNETRRSIAVRFGGSEEEASSLPNTSNSSNSNSSSNNNHQNSNSSSSRSDNVQRGGDDMTIVVVPTNPTPSNPTPDPTPQTPDPVTPSNQFAVLFVGNGATVGASSRTCETTSSSCFVRTPTISRPGYEILGWSRDRNAHSPDFAVDSNIETSGSVILYAVTRKTITATFEVLDRAHIFSASNSASCNLFNEETSCRISTPTLSAGEGYSALGWSNVENRTSADVVAGASLDFNRDTTFFSVSRRSAPLRAFFLLSDENAATFSGGTTECVIFNRATECALVAPTLVPNEDYSALGWHDPDDENLVSLESGETFYLSLENDGKSFYSVTRSEVLKTATFILQDQNAGTLNFSSSTCRPEPGETSCAVNLPTLELNPGFEFLGWSETAASETASLNGTTILLQEDKTFYSVTKNSSPLSATFTVQDSRAATVSGETSVSCFRFNGASTCEVFAPTLLENSGYEALGWNSDSSATSASVSSGGRASISSTTAFYSITREEGFVSATFSLQDSTISSLSGGETSCRRYNGASACEITAPTLRGSSGHSPLGWSRSRTSRTAEFASGARVSISGGEIFYAITEKSVTVSFVFDGSTTTETCLLYQGNKSCTFTFPTPSGDFEEFLGWSSSEGTTVAEYSVGEEKTVFEDTTFYGVAIRSRITITFISQDTTNINHFDCSNSLYEAFRNCADPEGRVVGRTSRQFNLLDGVQSVEDVLPNFVFRNSGYTALGWSATEGATTADYAPGATISTSRNLTLYSVSRRTAPVSATYTISTPSLATKSGGTDRCYLYNGASSCSLVAPNLSVSSGYIADGWGPSSSEGATIAPGATFSRSEDITLYSIVSTRRTIYFDPNTSFQNGPETSGWGSWYGNNIAATSLSASTATCSSFNGGSCTLTNVPRIYSEGNYVIGWSPYRGDGTEESGPSIYFPYRMSFNASTILYARVWNWMELPGYSVGETKKLYVSASDRNTYYPVEFQSTLNSNVRTAYFNYLETAFENLPALKTLNGKMRFAAAESYDAGDNGEYEGSAGITLISFGAFSPVDIRAYYPNIVVNYTKHAIIHELGHALDAAFYERTGSYLSDDAEIFALFETQSALPESSRILSEYAFTGKHEFFAEAFTAYYRDTFGGYADSSLGASTPELNARIGHFLCVAENNYNLGANCE